MGFSLKLSDFYLSNIDGTTNALLNCEWTNKKGIQKTKNHFADMYTCFKYLKGRIDNHFPEIENFLEKYLYKKEINYVKTCRILENVELTTPYQILTNDEFFNEFKIN